MKLDNFEAIHHYSTYPCETSVPAKQPQSIMLPPPHLKVSMIFLGLKSSPFTPPNIPSVLFTPIVAKKLSLCFIWPWNQKTFGSSMWSAADLSQVWRCWFWIRAFFLDRTVTVYGKGRLDPWWFLRNFLSSEGDSLSLLLDFGKGMTHLKNMYLCTIVWTVLWKF